MFLKNRSQTEDTKYTFFFLFQLCFWEITETEVFYLF